MIDRDDVSALMTCAELADKCSVNNGVLAELCRVYLAWLDAPEAFLENIYTEDVAWFGITELSGAAQRQLDGKRVRLVEVK